MFADSGCVKSSHSQPLGPLEKMGGTLCHGDALGCVGLSVADRTITVLGSPSTKKELMIITIIVYRLF